MISLSQVTSTMKQSGIHSQYKENIFMINLIVAADLNGAIGIRNKMPWHLPADLANFKKLTIGKKIIMGRKTFESLPGILPDRQHIIITRNKNYKAKGCVVVNSLREAIDHVGSHEAFIVGGGDIYRQAMDMKVVSKIHLTIVDTKLKNADTFFDLDFTGFVLVDGMKNYADSKNKYDFTFHDFISCD